MIGWVFLLALVMAVFAVLGYLRGFWSSLITAGVIWLGMVLVAQAAPKIADLVNLIPKGVAFIRAGGAGALAGGDASGAAVQDAFESMSNAPTWVTNDLSGLGGAVVFGVLLAVALAVGSLKSVRGKRSVFGLLVGLASGYLVGALLLNSLLPVASHLPVPYALQRVDGATAPLLDGGTVPSLGQAVGGSVGAFFEALGPDTVAPVLGIVILVILVLAATAGNRSTRKG